MKKIIIIDEADNWKKEDIFEFGISLKKLKEADNMLIQMRSIFENASTRSLLMTQHTISRILLERRTRGIDKTK